jgi:thiol-disulfide isomerase/thioredoxin
MSFRLLAAAMTAALALLSACDSTTGSSATADTATWDPNGGVPDVAIDTADVAPRAGSNGLPCATNEACDSGICFGGHCAKACTAPADCGTDEWCGSDDGKRLLCYSAKYPEGLGSSCAITGACDTNLACAGNPEASTSYCTGGCVNDTDCPPTMACTDTGDKKVCLERNFCDDCKHDGQCRDGGRCVKQGERSFCTRPCHKGSTECPRYAKCVDVGEGDWQCVHGAGTCDGDGSMCSPCNSGNSCTDGLCLTFGHTKESFCTVGCTAGKCDTGYSCESIPLSGGTKSSECVPAAPTSQCVAKLANIMKAGDTLADLSVVGYLDTDDDGSLANEDPHVIKLSDFADSHEFILINVVAGWCGYCAQETKEVKAVLKAYPNLQFFQVLFDGATQNSTPTLKLARQWISQLNAGGVVGVDPNQDFWTYNTGDGPPLNILIDAKTRKVKHKWNGLPNTSLINYLKPML